MSRGRAIVGALLLVIGGIWFLQGVGVLGEDGRGMTGSSTWAVIGPLVAAAGIALIIGSRRGSS
ncbi:MAG: hypothetical protein V7636_437 [Actinomycetota bacterium]|jgi:hypothetical protein